MNPNLLSVREIQKCDIEPITQYWLTADPAFLTGMGVDLNKMPSREEWVTMLSEQLAQPYPEKKSYCMIWLADNKAIGHCNVNKIKFGEEAYMHLHVWNTEFRKKGMGTELVKISLPYFFENLELKKIFSEPYALNPAPNRTLEKAGFTFVKEYITTPGFLNFEQAVNLWELTYEQYKVQK
ncbi:MAG TPA: GNAT family protein [Chitinophagaceae bacterium]|nr:GNAT family protein [Chitinophagaceae bacterium]